MRWPLAWRSRTDAELAAAVAATNRLRDERDAARTERESFRRTAQTAALQFTNTDRKLAAATKQLATHPGPRPDADPVIASPEEIEAWEARVKAHRAWTPPTDGESRPVDGASGRPAHPADDLRRALNRCRALQAVIDQSGKRVTR